jgi:ERCC4 domain
MEGHCFSCAVRFTTIADGERLCPRCRPPVTWGADGIDSQPEYDETAHGVTCPFTVIVDTREQRAYRFDGFKTDARQKRRRLFVPTTVNTIAAGDYSIDGCADKIAIERKSLADFCQSFGRNRAVELRKVEKLARLTFAAYMLEFTFDDLMVDRFAYSEVNPLSLRRTVMALQVRWPQVGWCFAGRRGLAEAWTYRLLEKWWVEFIERPMKEPRKKATHDVR